MKGFQSRFSIEQSLEVKGGIMKKRIFCILCMLIFVSIFYTHASAGMASQNFRISTSVLSGGGAISESLSFKNNGTLGQSSPLIDPADPPGSENFTTLSGFWYTVDFPFDMDLPSGWSMISLPRESQSSIQELFPEATAVFKFMDKYELVGSGESLEKGSGYWIYVPEAHTYRINGKSFASHTIFDAQSGWSMIGATSYESARSLSNGEIRAVFGFSNKYDLIGPDEPLIPGKGYWINISEQADITIEMKE